MFDSTSGRSFAEMTLRIVPGRIMNEGFAEQHLDLVVRPSLRG